MEIIFNPPYMRQRSINGTFYSLIIVATDGMVAICVGKLPLSGAAGKFIVCAFKFGNGSLITPLYGVIPPEFKKPCDYPDAICNYQLTLKRSFRPGTYREWIWSPSLSRYVDWIEFPVAATDECANVVDYMQLGRKHEEEAKCN